MNYHPNQSVRLHCPDNARLDGATARILALTPYGALVATAAAGSGEFRALVSEMVPDLEQGKAGTGGFTGSCCATCGSSRMVRSGTCETCQECGSNSGCS